MFGKFMINFANFFCLQNYIMKPKGLAIAAMAQYGIMPLTAFCLVKVGIYVKLNKITNMQYK